MVKSIGTKPVLPRNCRSARRMEGRKSGLRHRRRGGPALRGVAADRFDGLECGNKGAQAGRGTPAQCWPERRAMHYARMSAGTSTILMVQKSAAKSGSVR